MKQLCQNQATPSNQVASVYNTCEFCEYLVNKSDIN